MARLAGKIHPRDWVDVFNSHSPYEWALQVALATVEPWGDDRDDLRMAWNNAQRIASDRAEPMSAIAIQELVDGLDKYLLARRDPKWSEDD